MNLGFMQGSGQHGGGQQTFGKQGFGGHLEFFLIINDYTGFDLNKESFRKTLEDKDA
jgi:hypothetical protein